VVVVVVVVVVVAEGDLQDLAVTHRVQSLLALTVVSIADEVGTPTSTCKTFTSAPAFGQMNNSGHGRSATT